VFGKTVTFLSPLSFSIWGFSCLCHFFMNIAECQLSGRSFRNLWNQDCIRRLQAIYLTGQFLHFFIILSGRMLSTYLAQCKKSNQNVAVLLYSAMYVAICCTVI
jgi:hypothetical protein